MTCSVTLDSEFIGRRFDRVVVIARSADPRRWACVCDCGRFVSKVSAALRGGGRVGCKACRTHEQVGQYTGGRSHGASLNRRKTKLYSIWVSMRTRCRNPNYKSYRYYGGKGISISPEWETFEGFRDWAEAHGYVEGLSIERKNSALDYAPDNCEWITAKENRIRALGAWALREMNS